MVIMLVTDIEIDGSHYSVNRMDMEVDIETETKMVPKDGYKMEHFPDKYGGVTIPVPVSGPKKAQVMKRGEDVRATFDLSLSGPALAGQPWFNDGSAPRDVIVYIDDEPDIVLTDCIFGIQDDELQAHATGYETM